MGVIAELVEVVRTYYANRNGGPGETIYLEGKGTGGAALNSELYQAPGLMSRPAKGARGVFVPIGSGRSYGVVVALHDYRVKVVVAEGETTIYSTSSDGSAIKARIDLDSAGKIKIANSTRSLKTVLSSLINHLVGLTTINCVSGSPVTLSPTTISNLNADLTALGELLKD